MTNRKLTILTLLALPVLNSAAEVRGIESKFPLGKETTYVDGPLDAEGYVDYGAALNARLSRDVQPDDNANVRLWQALGPKEVSEKIRKEYFAALGMDVPPVDGAYYQTLGDYWKRLDFPHNPGAYEELANEQNEATQRPWKPDEFPRIAEWLAANEQPLAVVREAVRRKAFFDPLVCPPPTPEEPKSLMGAYLPGIQPWRDMTRALAARAMLRVAEARYDEAWNDLLAAHRLARHVAQSPTLVSYLAALSMEGLAATADAGFAAHAKLPAEKFRQCIDDLRRLPPLPGVATALDNGERCMVLDVVQGLKRDGLKTFHWLMGNESTDNLRFIDPIVQSSDLAPTMREANRWFDRMVAAARDTDRKASKTELERINADIKKLCPQDDLGRIGLFLGAVAGTPEVRGKRISDITLALFLPQAAAVQSSIDGAAQRRINVETALALAAYQAEHRRFPATLAELTPKYLPAVPQDLFAEAPLRYNTFDDGYQFYSIGANEKDDDGRSREDEPQGTYDDLVVRTFAHEK